MDEPIKTIYIVPHSHYDVVWAFCKEDYYAINEMILKDAVKLIRENDFKFLIEQTYLLEMIEERNPVLFSNIKEQIAAGKIEIADGQYLMADPMIPIGEILVREIIIGKQYCKHKFGVDVPVAWAADGFGLNAQMPQIYRKSGYKWLAFRRGLPKTIGYRVSEFVWKGLDGSKIISHWMPLGYRAGLYLDEWEKSNKILSSFATTPHILMPCGSGGVPPQVDTPSRVHQWNKKHDNSRMVISTPSNFFTNLEKDAKELAEYEGELYSPDLQNVFPDVVSSRISLKLAFKECENSLITAEKICALAYLNGKDYPSKTLSDMWKKMLFLVNHDVLACCGIDEIYGDAWEYIDQLRNDSARLIDDSARYLAGDNKRNDYISVFNPNNWEITDWVEVDIELNPESKEMLSLAMDGNKIPCEILQSDQNRDGNISRVRLGFIATVPPLSYTTYKLVKTQKIFESGIRVHGKEVENRYFKLIIDENSGIVHVYDKGGKKILEGNELIIDQEIGDLYFHKSQYDEPIGAEGGEGIHFSTFKPDGFTIEKGPVRTIITFKNEFFCLQWPYYLTEKFGSIFQRHKTLEVCKQVMIYNDIPRIGFRTLINSAQSHIRIRVRFDSCMVVPKFTRQSQFGVIDLPSTRTLEESVKFPSLNWLNCQEGKHGLGFFSRGVPINEVQAGKIYCTLLRSVSVLSTDGASGPLIPTPQAMELGEHLFTYAVYPHSGDWKEDQIHLRGHEFNHRLIAFPFGTLNTRKRLQTISVEPNNLIVSALKKSESDAALILRFFETKGERCCALLKLPQNIKSASLVDLLENMNSELEIRDGNLELEVNPFEIITIKLKFHA